MMITKPDSILVTEWPTSSTWVGADGILCLISKKVKPVTLAETKLYMEEFKRSLKGKMICMLADMTHLTKSSKAVKEYEAREIPHCMKAIALLSGSNFGKLRAHLSLMFKAPPYPAKVFTSETKARAWLKKYL